MVFPLQTSLGRIHPRRGDFAVDVGLAVGVRLGLDTLLVTTRINVDIKAVLGVLRTPMARCVHAHFCVFDFGIGIRR